MFSDDVQTVGSALKRNGVGHMTLGNELVGVTGDGLRLVVFTQYPTGDNDDWLSVGTIAAAAALAADGHPLKYRHGGYNEPYIC